MIKSLLSVLAIAVFSFSNAQGNINFGAKAGLNLASLSGDIEDQEAKTGFHIGGMAEISLSDKFSVQPELLFSTQGVGFESGDDDSINLSYINLPIMGKYYATEALSIEAGPQIGFLLSSEEEVEGDTVDTKDITSNVDFGLNFGLGYKLASGLNFSARYNLGLSNIIDIDGSDADVNNSVFQFSIGYFFN